MNAEQLLEGARGRSLCMAVAVANDEQFEGELGAVEDLAPMGYARLEQIDLPAETVHDLARRLIAASRSLNRTLPEPLNLYPYLQVAVDASMPWQRPLLRDAITSLAVIREALIPIAEFVLESSAAAWWSDGMAGSQQWATAHVRDGEVEPFASKASAAQSLALWKSLQEAEEKMFDARTPEGTPFETSLHGAWWSTPNVIGDGPDSWASLPSSSRRLGSLGSIALALVEDGDGDTRAELHQVTPARESRVFEVHGREDWAALVERYPCDARWSRRAVWGEATGLDLAWRTPDYAAAGNDFDGIHVSVKGYLSTAGEVIPLAGEYATVLAGWSPDETYWLTDSITTSAQTEDWERYGNEMHEWRRVKSTLVSSHGEPGHPADGGVFS